MDEGASREELLAIVRELRATVARQGAAIAALQARRGGNPAADSIEPAAERVGQRSRKPATAVALPAGFDYVVTFDGGSLGNPGKGYGSYQIAGQEGVVTQERLEFGDAVTSNQAEYRTLIGALEDLTRRLGDRAGNAAVAIRGDSQLVIEQIAGRWKVKHAELQPLHRRAVALLSEFGRAEVAWHRRNNSVRVLGH